MIASRKQRDREWQEQERLSVATLFDAIPPQDLEAERSVLGSLILENETYDDVQPHLPTADRFFADAHRRIYSAIQRSLVTGSPVDAVTLANELERKGDLELIGGPAYILQVLESVPHSAHAAHYARIVADKWKQRAVIDTCTEAMREAHVARDNVQEVIAAVETKIRDLGQETASEPRNFKAALESWVVSINQVDERPVVPSGFKDLDELMVGGFRGGQLIILAARPGVGKSALAGNFAMHAALSMRSSLMSILEQSERELVERLLAGHSRVDHRRIQEGNLNEQETFAVEEAGEKLVNSPLYFDDVPRRSVADISAIARRHKRKHGLDMLVIDYLQLLQPDDPRQVREQQVSGMTRGLKFLAKEMNVPVICLAQLNRGVENREDKTPRLSDLRESGAIEQDADVVMFIDRPHEYDKAANPADAFLHVAKNRGGSKGKVDLVWRATNLLFLPKAPFDPGGF